MCVMCHLGMKKKKLLRVLLLLSMFVSVTSCAYYTDGRGNYRILRPFPTPYYHRDYLWYDNWGYWHRWPTWRWHYRHDYDRRDSRSASPSRGTSRPRPEG